MKAKEYYMVFNESLDGDSPLEFLVEYGTTRDSLFNAKMFTEDDADEFLKGQFADLYTKITTYLANNAHSMAVSSRALRGAEYFGSTNLGFDCGQYLVFVSRYKPDNVTFIKPDYEMTLDSYKARVFKDKADADEFLSTDSDYRIITTREAYARSRPVVFKRDTGHYFGEDT